MKEFMLLFRSDYKNMQYSSPEEWQAVAKKWQDWIKGIAAKDKWVAAGTQLSPEGKVIRPNGIITDGPYAETKESLLSYCVIKAESLEEAAKLSEGCPVFETGGTVEIREMMNSKSWK